MPQPTLASIPGILLRTVLRVAARVLFTIGGAVILLGATVIVSAVLLATWRSARTNRVQATVQLVVAAVALWRELRASPKSA